MLKGLLIALLVANGLFFAWARGWLAPAWPAPAHGDREPGRLAAQVRPEQVLVMSAPAASAALAAAAAASAAAQALCLEAGPYNDAEITAAEAELARAALPAASWKREQVERAASFIVYFGRFADRDALRGKEEELRRLKLVVEPLTAPPELVPGLMLARYDSREAADTALAQLNQRGVRTARVVALPAPPLQHWLRAEHADLEQQARLRALKPAAMGAAGFVPCVKAP